MASCRKGIEKTPGRSKVKSNKITIFEVTIITKSQFKNAMQCGLGSCIITLKTATDINKYKDIILWGCLRNLSFDTQCEGTRAYYLYALLSYFEDDLYFEVPVILKFLALPSNGDWEYSHFSELVCLFAECGSQNARNALDDKYNTLYSALRRIRKSSRKLRHIRDDFESLAVNLTSLDGISVFYKIAKDIGELLIANSAFDEQDFLWFYHNSQDKFGEKRLNCRLEKLKASSPALDRFLTAMNVDAFSDTKRQETPIPTAEDLISIIKDCNTISPALRVRFSYRADDTEKQKLAKAALLEDDITRKIAMLSIFGHRHSPFPLDATPLIEYAFSDNGDLREITFELLENAKGEHVRTLALELLQRQERMDNAICMLETNYKKSDKDTLLSALLGLKVSYSDDSHWHSVVMHLIGMFGRGNRTRLPNEVLYYIYNSSLCSYCRYRAVEILGKCKAIPPQMLEECMFDSNVDIRQYAKRLLNLKNKRLI